MTDRQIKMLLLFQIKIFIHMLSNSFCRVKLNYNILLKSKLKSNTSKFPLPMNRLLLKFEQLAPMILIHNDLMSLLTDRKLE